MLLSKLRPLVYIAALGLIATSLAVVLASAPIRARTFSRIAALYAAVARPDEPITLTRVYLPERRPEVKVSPRLQALPPIHRPQAPVRAEDKTANEGIKARTVEEKMPTEAEKSEAALPKTAEHQLAYNLLLSENKKMAELVANTNPDLRFKAWSVLRVEGDDYWVDVVFNDAKLGAEVHYVWQVNVVSKRITPLSHEARSLAVR